MGQEHALQHRSPDLGLGGERHIVRNAGASAARAIIGPGLGQVERAVDQRPAMAAGIGEEDANLAVLDASRSAGVLAVDPGRLGALLEKAGLVQHQDRVGITQVLDHIGAQIIAERIGVPVNAREERLHAVWRVVAGRLGKMPAVLPLQGGQQALKIRQGASARLRTPEPRGNPPGNRLQLLSPVLGFASARHGSAPPLQAEQRAKPGCSTKQQGTLRDWAYARIPWLVAGAFAVVGLAVIVSLTIDADAIAQSNLGLRRWGLLFPILSLAALLAVLAGARARCDGVPFTMTVAFFVAAFLTLGVMLWPYMIPYALTVADAAGP